MSITFAQPHFRKPIYALDKYKWSIEEFRIGDGFHYFVYAMTKGRELADADKNFCSLISSSANNNANNHRKYDLNENDIFNLDTDFS